MRSKRCTERVIASPTPEPARRRGSLTRRILLVNLIALLLFGGALFYLDGFRVRLIAERRAQKEAEVLLIATVLARTPSALRRDLLVDIGTRTRDHLRVFDSSGQVILDNWRLDAPTYTLVDPASEPWRRHVARAMDRAIDRLVGADIPPAFTTSDQSEDWNELAEVVKTGGVASRIRLAPDRTIMSSAAAPIGRDGGALLLSVENARDVTRLVRAERFRLGMIVLVALLVSAWLSVFLARTIVQPLQRLAAAAGRVRLGRAREVVVPRLPLRDDEIGRLARAVSDMSQALRQRIDAIEAFAADVTHELKNPLASLRSATESLGRVSDDAQRTQLLGIVEHDVRRLDRLITDISELSRLDAQLTRARFERVDLGTVIEAILAERRNRGGSGPQIAFARPRRDTAVVNGEAARLARAIENLLENALSFTPADGVVRVGATRVGDEVLVTVEDQGPGVAIDAREAIFRRFHSDRPDQFGGHSGLGLAIAKTIVEGHDGKITVGEGESGKGARFEIMIPAAGDEE